MFVATEDVIVSAEDNRKIKNKISTVVYYQEVGFDHLSFVLAKDMSYFKDVIDVI